MTTDKDAEVRWNAAKVLGDIGNEKTIESIMTALKDDGGESTKKVKDIAFDSLEKINKRYMKRITIEPIYEIPTQPSTSKIVPQI